MNAKCSYKNIWTLFETNYCVINSNKFDGLNLITSDDSSSRNIL